MDTVAVVVLLHLSHLEMEQNRKREKHLVEGFDLHCNAGLGQCSLSEVEMEGCHDDSASVLSSTLDVSDEEISTKKENHWRLGPEDLNDTIVYDFLEFEKA